MEWKESHEFVKTFTQEEKKRYRILIQRFGSMDGHNSHMAACDKIEEERKKDGVI